MSHSDLRRVATFVVFVTLVTAAFVARAEPPEALPAGTYQLDKAHTCILFRISHLGFSHFTGRFDSVEGSLTYNPALPEQTMLDVTIYPNGVDTNDVDLDNDLRGQNWFDVIKYPRAIFHTIRIERTGDTTAKITGDFTLRGVTHTLVLDATLVGAGSMPLTGDKVMGFNATGSFDRSDYGMNNLQPMVGDEVTLQIDTEFDHTNAKEE